MNGRAALAIALLAASPCLADDPKPAAGPPTAVSDLSSELSNVADETIKLAEAIPADKYGWRPGPGVRSVSEVYMHIVRGHHLILGFAGEKPAVSVPREMETTVTDKAKVVEHLKASFDFARKSLASKTDADLAKPVKFFGRDSTVRALYLRTVVHSWEHLGQSVAYARVNGIVPPWSGPPPGK